MRALLLSLLALLLSTLATFAQSLSLFDVNTAGFPVITARFYAFDGNGKQVRPKTEELRVSEDGAQRSILSVNCPPVSPPKDISTVLVFDVSGSMSSGVAKEPSINLAKAAATAWVNALPTERSECAVASFDDVGYINADFTTDRNKLLDRIQQLMPMGSTEYDSGFLLSSAGGLRITTRAKYQRVLVFLTDGMPNREPQTNAIIAEAQRQGCIVFAVTLGVYCPASLKSISEQTGGQWFENVTTLSEAVEVYKKILQAVNGWPPCEVSWLSQNVCSTGRSQIVFEWNSRIARTTFLLPAQALARLRFEPSFVFFRAKPVGQRFDTVITVTAVNSSFTVTGITSSNPAYSVSPTSFSLSEGQSQSLIVSYSPSDSSYSWTSFDIQNSTCTAKLDVAGGHPSARPTLPTLRLISPDGGEVFVAGSDTTITWEGVPSWSRMRIEFSADNGATWRSLTQQATEGAYCWHVPTIQSRNCLVKINHLGADLYANPGGWVKSIGGNGSDLDISQAVSVDSSGDIYVTGSFRATSNASGINLKSNGGTDVFIAKYFEDGTIQWAKNIGGSGQDEGRDISVDAAGNIYVSGTFQNSVDFEGIILNATSKENMFVARYSPDGTLDWVRQVGSTVSLSSRGIAVTPAGHLFVTGHFVEQVSFNTLTLSSTSIDNADIYIAKYNPDGTVAWLRGAGGNGDDAGNAITIDGSGAICLTGFFSGTASFDGTEVMSAGSADVFIARYTFDGDLDWVRRAGGASAESAQGIYVDNFRNICITGYFTGYADFNGTVISSAGESDLFVAKYSPTGVLDWVRRTGGLYNDEGLDLCADTFGNVYVSGFFTSMMDLYATDSTDSFLESMTSHGGADALVVKYDPDGNSEWHRYAGGKGYDRGSAIAYDGSGNVFITGRFEPQADFSGIRHGAGSSTAYLGDAFLWKIGDMTLQSDTSDAVFSIVMPSPASHDIDMGQVLLSSTKDSVIQSFVANAGTYRFNVLDIEIIGADASQFDIVSGFPPFDVAAGGAHHVEFRFKPSSSGVKTAQVRIITQADTLVQTIRGEGVAPTLAVVGDVIDFGQLEIGSQKDTTLTVAIRNIGMTPVDFTGASQLGPDMQQFTMLSGDAPFTLAPGSSHSVTLRFAPQFNGRTSGRIGFAYNGVGSPAVIHLFGQGLGGLVSIADDSAFVGEERQIALHLEQVKTSSLQSVEATSFRARIAYDGTILYPRAGEISRGEHYDTVAITGTLGNDNVLARLPFVAMLGTDEVSPLEIIDFEWLDGSGQPVEYDVETRSGTFRLIGICEEGGTRLYNPSDRAGIVKITPNPIGDAAEIEIVTIESGRTRVVVMDMLGREVATIFDGELPTGHHRMVLQTNELTTGSYHLLLATPTVRCGRRVGIVK